MRRRSKVAIVVAFVALLILTAVFGFAYYSQSAQVGSLNTQAQSLSSEVQTLQSEVSSANSPYSIANLGKAVVLADKLNITSQCIGPHLETSGQIVAFQANYTGYLVVTVSDFTNNSKAFPLLGLGDTASYPRLNRGNAGVYIIPFPTTSTHISFTTNLPVSPPGYVVLRLYPVDPLEGLCVTGANDSGTFSVTYYY